MSLSVRSEEELSMTAISVRLELISAEGKNATQKDSLKEPKSPDSKLPGHFIGQGSGMPTPISILQGLQLYTHGMSPDSGASRKLALISFCLTRYDDGVCDGRY